jgi:hypothetical protein
MCEAIAGLLRTNGKREESDDGGPNLLPAAKPTDAELYS